MGKLNRNKVKATPSNNGPKKSLKKLKKKPIITKVKHETRGETPEKIPRKDDGSEAGPPPKAPKLEPVPTDIPDPKLDPNKIKMLKPLIGYIYNGDQLTLKLSFEQAGLLLVPDYDEKRRVFRFLVNTKEICRSVGEKAEAHSIAREKLVQIVRYYCYVVKRVKEYHTRRHIFYTNPPKDQVQARKDTNKIREENIGYKMLQKQGWNPGTALGVSEDGILEPIVAKKRKGKSGLGTENAEMDALSLAGKAKISLEAFYLVLKQYAGVNALYDIVFSTQFSKHQVAKLSNFARGLKLRPQMIGTNKKKLVVSRPLTIKEIKDGIMKGHSDLCAKYVVIPPGAGIPDEDKKLYKLL